MTKIFTNSCFFNVASCLRFDGTEELSIIRSAQDLFNTLRVVLEILEQLFRLCFSSLYLVERNIALSALTFP